jgi:SNF2 family DNA or RNA helicase
MIIRPKSKKVILNLQNKERVLSVIPGAKILRYKGVDLVVVPHRTQEVKILNNLGIAAPYPINHYYDYPMSRGTPFDHQRVTSEFLTKHPRAYCLNDMGTGKTLSVLWAYDFLRKEGAVNKLLVISPLSTLEETWGSTIFRHFPHLTFAVVHGDRARRRTLLEDDYDIYIINHDGAKIMEAEISAKIGIDIVVIDEIAQVGRNVTDKWKALRRIIKGKPTVWGLTGTPTPSSPEDAWAQCRLVTPNTVPLVRGKFKDMVLRKVGQFTWVSRPEALDIVHKAMQPSIRYKRSDCIDLPPCTYETRSVEMTPEQKHLYQQMLSKFHAVCSGSPITAANEAVMVMKLVQIATGVVYDNDRKPVYAPATSRLHETHDIIEQAGGKVIVFVPFTSALVSVAEYLSKSFTVEIVNGQTSKGARDRIFREFQYEDNPRVLVANAGAMSHGLTLTAADTIVWFAPINSLETYEQANARITRPGQTRNQLIIHIEGSPVERATYARLQAKGKMQGMILKLMEQKV